MSRLHFAQGPYLTGFQILLALRVAVASVTVLLLASLVALWHGRYRLHGRLNLCFFTLSLVALLGLEAAARFMRPNPLEEYLRRTDVRQALRVHLAFSIPATVVMPAMLYTGLAHRRRLHLILAGLFAVLWTGTFVTGIFFLPNHP